MRVSVSRHFYAFYVVNWHNMPFQIEHTKKGLIAIRSTNWYWHYPMLLIGLSISFFLKGFSILLIMAFLIMLFPSFFLFSLSQFSLFHQMYCLISVLGVLFLTWIRIRLRFLYFKTPLNLILVQKVFTFILKQIIKIFINFCQTFIQCRGIKHLTYVLPDRLNIHTSPESYLKLYPFAKRCGYMKEHTVLPEPMI